MLCIFLEIRRLVRQGKKEWKNKALKLAPWFFLAKAALKEQFSRQAIRCFLHFPLGGGMVELEVREVVLAG